MKIKNLTILPNGKAYNFGIRKPVLNCWELLQNSIWSKYLIDKWVCMYDPVEGKYVYFKHVFRNNRVIQVIYSGVDILGDGIYTLYKAKIIEHKDGSFMVVPDEYNLNVGSFECEDFLRRLLKEKYITRKEFAMFRNPRELEKFTKTLVRMNDKDE